MVIPAKDTWKIGVLLSSDPPTTTKFVEEVFKFLDSNTELIIIDANHIITPETLIDVPEEYLANIIIIKPSSISGVGTLLDNLISLRENNENDIIILVCSLYVQLPFETWAIQNYDPLFILHGLAEITRIYNNYRVILVIDTQADQDDMMPYQEILTDIVDWIIRGFYKDNNVVFRRIK